MAATLLSFWHTNSLTSSYEPVGADVVSDDDLISKQNLSFNDKSTDGTDSPEYVYGRRPESRRTHLCLLLITVVSLAISLVLEIGLRGRLNDACIKLMEPWGPMTHLVQFEWQQFDSEFCPVEYCGPPTEIRENAWKALWDYGWMGFPQDSLQILNKSSDASWLHLLPPKDETTLVAMPEVIHQLHCLSLVREAIYRNQFDYAKYINISNIAFDLHVDHCLLALKLVIECKSDVSPVVLQEHGSDDVQGEHHISAWKLRDAPKRCRRAEPLAQWYAENTICSSKCNADEIYGVYEHGD